MYLLQYIRKFNTSLYFKLITNILIILYLRLNLSFAIPKILLIRIELHVEIIIYSSSIFNII